MSYRQFKAWKESWENYAECVQLGKQSRVCQVSAFWGQCSGGFLGYIRNYLGIERATSKSLPTILAEIEKDLKSQVNISKVRYDQVHRKQEDRESFADFYGDLRLLAEEAGLEGMSEND